MFAEIKAHYRKTFIPMQICILLVLTGLILFAHMPFAAILVFFLVMEIFSVFGAAWAVRLKSRIDGPKDSLPLNRR